MEGNKTISNIHTSLISSIFRTIESIQKISIQVKDKCSLFELYQRWKELYKDFIDTSSMDISEPVDLRGVGRAAYNLKWKGVDPPEVSYVFVGSATVSELDQRGNVLKMNFYIPIIFICVEKWHRGISYRRIYSICSSKYSDKSKCSEIDPSLDNANISDEDFWIRYSLRRIIEVSNDPIVLNNSTALLFLTVKKVTYDYSEFFHEWYISSEKYYIGDCCNARWAYYLKFGSSGEIEQKIKLDGYYRVFRKGDE